jgi:putative sigma-54 modulation protein
MQINVVFRHMESSKALREYAEKKLERVRASGEKIIEIEVVYIQEKQDFIVEFLANFQGHTLKVTERDGSAFAATDLAIDKFNRQLHRIQDRSRDRKHAPSI